MPNPFDLIRKKKSLQEKKEAYKKAVINNLEQFKFDIARPLLNMSEYHSAVQRYFSQGLVTLEEKFAHSSLIQQLKEQYIEKIIGLTERLNSLREMTEKQQISSEAVLLDYTKTHMNDLSDITKSAEEFFQQVNKDIAELLGFLTTVAFEQSDSFSPITDQIRNAIRRDLSSVQGEWLAPDEHLFKILSALLDSEALPQSIREQLLGTFEKLNSSKNAKFMVVSLNAAFNTVPNRFSEIGCDEKTSITARIQGLGRCLEEKSVEPLEHYLMIAQDYFSLLLRLDRDDPNLVSYIEAHLTDEQLLKRLLEKFKKNELTALRILKQAFRTPLERDVKILKEMSDELGDSSEPLNNLLDEYNGRLGALELTFEENVNDYHKLTSFSELSSYYATILEMITLHSTDIRKKAAEYRWAERMFKKARCLDKEEIDFFFKEINDPDYRKILVKSLTDKIFHLLGKLPANQFGNYIENLLQFAAVEEAQRPSSARPDDLFSCKKELRDSIRGKHLACFIKQQSEKIAEYLDNKRGGRYCGPFSLLNGYLNYCDLSQLDALGENRLDLQETIARMKSTKQLLDFQNKYHHGSLWGICEWFSKVDRHELSLPLFTTPQDRSWFFSTMDSISFLRNAITGIDRINNEKNHCRATFFFLNGSTKAKKREALEQLKEDLKTLPNLIDNQALDEKIEKWEREYGAVIDKQRYRFYLIVGVMLYQILKYYIAGQTLETKSRHCVEHLKKHLYKAKEAMQDNFQEGMAKNTLPLPTGLTP